MAARVSKSEVLAELANQGYQVEMDRGGHTVLLGARGDHFPVHLYGDDFDRDQLIESLERQGVDTGKLSF